MVPILSLWAPILVAGVLVFVASSVIHMFLGYHANDYGKLADEDGIMSALRPFNPAPGEYVFPYAGSNKAMQSEEWQAKVKDGPAGFVTVLDGSSFTNMGPSLVKWFVYCLFVAAIAAYLGGRMLGPSAEYLSVFRVTGTTAFCCFALGAPQRSIWFHQKWSTTFKSIFDGLIYAMLTAGAFGWLWPEM